MGEKLVIGPINKGLRNDVTAFNVDNDSFPTLINAYQWRGRVKRKRGTSLLCRLQRLLGTTNGSGNLTVTISPTPIKTGVASFTVGTDIFYDPGTTANPGTQTLLTNGSGTGTLNRTTGVLTITGSQINSSVLYFPTLPVMGLEEFFPIDMDYPGTIAFDVDYSYRIPTNVNPVVPYDVSFFNNPGTGTYPGYVAKSTWTPLWWNGQDYQQFWSVNYQNALWVTNGVTEPFVATNIGMQFKLITGAVINMAGPPAIVTFTIVNHGLVQGDFVFINEIVGMTGINFQTGYVINTMAFPITANTFAVEFPIAVVGGAYSSGGIAQYLTSNAANPSLDCIRWYNGDPANVSGAFTNGVGWVNFMPPLSKAIYSIADLPPAQYYLVGAKIIFPFKDRLLFLAPVVQTSTGTPMFLEDTIIYSENGTPYYTSSFAGTNPELLTTVQTPVLVPAQQTADAAAYFSDITGYGGFITAGIAQSINSCENNKDVLIIGFDTTQTKLIYSGTDIVPFNFFIVNSDLGTSSVFSAISFDKGVMSRGDRGYIVTSQYECNRVDVPIPDEVFDVQLANQGAERICAIRDFSNEWCYYSYPSGQSAYRFPTQTLQYNYRDDSWALFYETYTTYGTFRRRTGYTWATIGQKYPTWSVWNSPWNSTYTTLLEPLVIAGNQQGYVLVRDDGTTQEGNSISIQNLVSNVITSPDHCLNSGDYILITGCDGTVGNIVNGRIFSVTSPSQNSFIISPGYVGSYTYQGGGEITRIYVPLIQTRQFPFAWSSSNKTRIGPQQYLLTTTQDSQISLNIYLSQNANSPYNAGPIIPSNNSTNNALIYSNVLYTCPESANLGLTPANVSQVMISDPTTGASPQQQIWHRINTSLIGDTVQLGFTLSQSQVTSLTPIGIAFAITAATQATSCAITTTANFPVGSVVMITGVVGMTQLNLDNELTLPNYYIITASSSSNMTLGVNSTGFGVYISGGLVQVVTPTNPFAEIELHSIILDVQRFSVLA